MMTLIIHNDKRRDRFEHMINEINAQLIQNYRFTDAVMDDDPATGIAEAHKNCIRHAKLLMLPCVILMEDDCMFTCENAWRYFLSHVNNHMKNNIPFDVIMGGVYTGQVYRDEKYGVNRVKNFSSTHLVCYHERFYSKVLDCPPGTHIDHWLSDNAKHASIAYPMPALQCPGYSDQKKSHVDHTHLLAKHGLEVLKEC